MKSITKKLVRILIDYNPETGSLVWKKRPQELFPNAGAMESWNSRCALKEISCVDNLGYISTSIFDIKIHAHRIAFLHYHGYIPEIVDHKNGIKTDNRIHNLRPATKSENALNSKIRGDNKSGVKGVGWCKAAGKWRARLKLNGKEIHLGLFNSIPEAEKVVTAKRRELIGEFANNG